MFAETKKQIDALVQIASDGADPLQVANLFFEQQMMDMDDDSYGKLCALLNDTNCISTLSMFNQGVKSHAVFFESLRTQLVKRIQEEDEAAQNS